MSPSEYDPNCPICTAEFRDGLDERYEEVAVHMVRVAEESAGHRHWIESYASDDSQSAVREALEEF